MLEDRQWRSQLDRDGFVLLPGVFRARQVELMLCELTAGLQGPHGDAATMRSAAGNVYGARNLLELWPGSAVVWRQPPLPAALATTLGADYGLVRVLYFDKPPDRS